MKIVNWRNLRNHYSICEDEYYVYVNELTVSAMSS